MQFNRATTPRSTEIVLIPADDDAPIRFDVAKPTTGGQILEHPLHITHLGFPFRAIRTAGVRRLRICLQGRLSLQAATGDVLIQQRAPRIESGPQRRLVGPMLAEQRLERHRLVRAFNLGIVMRLIFAYDGHFLIKCCNLKHNCATMRDPLFWSVILIPGRKDGCAS